MHRSMVKKKKIQNNRRVARRRRFETRHVSSGLIIYDSNENSWSNVTFIDEPVSATGPGTRTIAVRELRLVAPHGTKGELT